MFVVCTLNIAWGSDFTGMIYGISKQSLPAMLVSLCIALTVYKNSVKSKQGHTLSLKDMYGLVIEQTPPRDLSELQQGKAFRFKWSSLVNKNVADALNMYLMKRKLGTE